MSNQQPQDPTAPSTGELADGELESVSGGARVKITPIFPGIPEPSVDPIRDPLGPTVCPVAPDSLDSGSF